ncbi:MAG: hypothetical protein OXP75_06270 [Rhodospirillales bacterium]|nr:hypothetical protein [Rhodospirillales bacterium]
MAKALEGACHCGAIGVALEVEDDTPLSPRHCGCSFCQKHGSLYISAPSGRLTITLTEPERVSRYAFGHETATFLVCSRCGVIAAAVCEMEGRLHSVLNSNLLEPPLDVDRASVPVADYEAEDIPDRLERRKQRWIGTVTIVER